MDEAGLAVLGFIRASRNSEKVRVISAVLQCQEEWFRRLTPVELRVPFHQKGTGKHAKCAKRNQNVEPTQVRRLVQRVDHGVKPWSQQKRKLILKRVSCELLITHPVSCRVPECSLYSRDTVHLSPVWQPQEGERNKFLVHGIRVCFSTLKETFVK